MQTPLNASASTAGALLSSSTFVIPQFQREYAWQEEQVSDFWNDLSKNIDAESYFLGLVILTDDDNKKHVVDGQQRLITISLLANAIYHEAVTSGRKALADRIQADFLRSIDFDSDETRPRIVLSDAKDNDTFQNILSGENVADEDGDLDSTSSRMAQSYRYLVDKLRDDLGEEPFKRLGKWADFLTNRVYFAVFIHPDPASAYQVYEVINTRGKELTPADLLKNYVLSKTIKERRQSRYEEWKRLSSNFASEGANSFVQYIRHSVTVKSGYVPPKDLYALLAKRIPEKEKLSPDPDELMTVLAEYMPVYTQIVDPSLSGPVDTDALKIFAALNGLGVIAVRPILLALVGLPDYMEGMSYILRLVVRRIVVGNLGAGSIERHFGDAAKKIRDSGSWTALTNELKEMNPSRQEFVEQLRKRSYNKGALTFLRRSILEKSITPEPSGTLHFIWTRQPANGWALSEEDGAFWGSTIGNTFLSTLSRRPKSANDWNGFKRDLLPYSIKGEWKDELQGVEEWNAGAVENMGEKLAQAAAEIWY